MADKITDPNASTPPVTPAPAATADKADQGSTGVTSPLDLSADGTQSEDTTGRTIIENVVVGKIAGIAAREVSGVYNLGGGAARVMGTIRDTFGASSVQQGINVEVGERQAAVDLSIVAEYGVAIHELAEAIRRNIIVAIERMTGLEVTEVNVTVTDIHLPSDDQPSRPDSSDAALTEAQENHTPRVQ